ncbi:unnamed protein product [Pieris macdunnoughi]|uniref:Uncharacterized protein n=1 Tax=Pieris macdunnoughi TaxID=345717 RepID=A0A821PNI2_9NEOP|nr:unnamed protein product [Pieris macdunnoughi]
MSDKNKSVKIRESIEGKALDTEERIERLQDGEASASTTYELFLCVYNPNAYSSNRNRVEFEIVEKEPIFVIVDSSCESNPSSREILINNNKGCTKETDVPTYLRKHVFPIDLPSTSKEIREGSRSMSNEAESKEELQVMDINLQSDSELPVQNFDNEDQSIVVTYLKNKDKVNRRDGVLLSSKKRSSLLNDVPKLETIPESDQVSTVIDPSIKISESSLDVYIPSFPGSPRSLDYASEPSNDSEFEEYQHDPRLKEAIEFLHADKDLLIAAETGNDQHIEMILRRSDIPVQQMDHLGRNALHLAVCSDNLRGIELLLKGGVSPNVKDSVGMTPLSLCLMRRPSLTVAKLLFDYGAKLMPRTDPMDTGLFIQFVMMSTPTNEEENIMELLIQKGALVNDPDAPGGRQPLHFAAMSNNCTLIRILVNLGASLYLTNHRNETPKQVAATFDCRDAYDLLNKLESEDMLPMQSRGRQTSLF